MASALLVNNIAIGRLDDERIDRIARLIMPRKPVADWPAELFTIDDNIHRKVTLLGVPYVPGSALDAAIALGRCGHVRRDQELPPARTRRRRFSHPDQDRRRAQRGRHRRNTSSATPTKASPELSRIACC